MAKTAIIIGAGPAGLTAAYEFINKTDIVPVILEKTNDVGGISKTHEHNGNLMDMGGHRFFSKSDKVMKMWNEIYPLQGKPAKDDKILNREFIPELDENNPDPEENDNVMLIRNRVSRILYEGKFYDYPIALNFSLIKNLGIIRGIHIGISYIISRINKVKIEKSLEDFMVNRFGKKLYQIFFKNYTEKIWGMNPNEISPDWGKQRIKEISIIKILENAIKKIFRKKNGISQKELETSLIEKFLYPKLGPGSLYNSMLNNILSNGGSIIKNAEVTKILQDEKNNIIGVEVNNSEKMYADYVLSTMPIKDLINSLEKDVDNNIIEIANGLMYREFVTVGVLVDKLKLKNNSKIKSINNIIPDNWIYIQEENVKMCRIQIFNNWSPYLINDDSKIWLGAEYMCGETDDIWNWNDEQIKKFVFEELELINILDSKDIVDSCVVRMPKAYPSYFGTYNRLEEVREYLNKFDNLFLIGRNGMHRYNNMDHSMLTAMQAVENIRNNLTSKENIWKINTEEIYHEEK